jgi:serine/threonine protein phosphatase PrpC
MSESIRATCVEMDTNVRMRDASGTTLSGVFIVVDALSASTRVYCANVGDSRSVLFTAPRKLATDTSSPYMVARTLDSELSHWQEDGAVNIRAGATYALSTDHKLSNGKERRRLQSAEPQKLEWHPYPTRVLEIGVQASMSASQDSSSQVEIRLSPLTTDLASIAPEVLDTGIIRRMYVAFSALMWLYLGDGQALSPADCLVERRQRREASFIGNRMSAEGTEVGPEALFGRFNVSLTMTRSIGDKFAARSCLALPDVTLAVLDLSMHVRLVLGSDGLWDVLSDKWIAGMVFREATAASAAKRIAEVAAETRRKYVEHIDDVTVLVVDLCATQSGSAPRFGGGLGGCCVPS